MNYLTSVPSKGGAHFPSLRMRAGLRESLLQNEYGKVMARLGRDRHCSIFSGFPLDGRKVAVVRTLKQPYGETKDPHP